MIYKSRKYLKFFLDSLRKTAISTKAMEVTYLIVANDASSTVLAALDEEDVPYLTYKDPKPEDYWLNRVYRAWNVGGFAAPGEVLVFVNSDMYFAPGWLENLLAELTSDTIPCSRLVESGKMPSGQHAISENFGRSPDEFQKERFEEFAKSLMYTGDETAEGGLFMPIAFYKSDFVEAGGYPPGNICQDGVGAYPSQVLETGDHYFVYSNPVMATKKHITVLDSICYHIQNGEIDD